MIDFFNINDSSANRRIFYFTGLGNFQTWQKPRNAKFVHFYVIGGGGGGGNGVGGGSGTARRGGGGGGSSSVTTGLFMANLLPDILYINVGSGGTASGSVQNGSLSYVMLYPDSALTATNIVLQSGDAAGGGGQSGAAGGAAGSAGTTWSATGSFLNDLGLVQSYFGQAGTAGQTTPVPTNLFISGSTTGGGAGAGTNGATAQNGASIISGGQIPTISGGTTTDLAGSSGYMSTIPSLSIITNKQLVFTGGGGGASTNLATGGTGGNGAYGCGGGGGGAGGTGGNGGKGGDGLVIITTW